MSPVASALQEDSLSLSYQGSPNESIRVGLCHQQKLTEMMTCDFGGQVIEDTLASTLYSRQSLALGEASWHAVMPPSEMVHEMRN